MALAADARARLRSLKSELDKLIGRPLVLMMDNFQGASFFGELTLYKQTNGRNSEQELLVVTFSHYGDLCTIYTGDYVSRQLPTDVVEQVIGATKKHGFIYVSDGLREMYTGQQDEFKGRRWDDRFFGWD